MYLVGHVVGSFVAWPMSLVLMDSDQQPRKYASKKKKKMGRGAGKRVSEPKTPQTQPQEHEHSLASSSFTIMLSQQPDKASTIPTSLSRLLTGVMEKDNLFILSISTDLSLYGLLSHEIIVVKEDVELMTNFYNITTACISLYIRYNIISFYFLF